MKRNSTQAHELHNLLKKTFITPEAFAEWIEGTSDEMSRQLLPIKQYLEKRAPQSLYRIRRYTDDSVGALENEQLFFTRADWFNDPYDCLLQFDERRLRNQIENNISEEYMRNFLRSSGVQYPINEDIQNENDFLRLFREGKNGFLGDVSKCFTTVTDMLQKGTYVVCLGETVNSPVMWSHYGENHKGFAIEYQFEPEYFSPKPHFPVDDKFDGYGWRSLLPVYYSKYRVDGTQLAEWYCLCEMRRKFSPAHKQGDHTYLLPDMLLKTKLSLEKAEAWAYEKEWRLILTHEWPNDIGTPIVQIQKKAAGIYLGARMEDAARRKRLIQIGMDKEIPVYEMYIDHSAREYEMKWRQLL